MKKIISFICVVMMLTNMSFARDNTKDFESVNTVYREKTIKNSDGKQEKIREIVKQTIPSEELVVVLDYKYVYEKPADNVVLTLPIAKEFIYIPGTATDEKWVWFSADGGKTFARFKDLKVLDKNGVPRIATGKDVTHLQWRHAKKLSKGDKGKLEYHVMIR